MTSTLPAAPAGLGAGAGARAGALRRSPRDSQRDFATLLDVLSRPGKIGRLEVPQGVPAAAVAACGLVDVEVPLHVLATDDAEDQGWRAAAHAATSAPRGELGLARTVLALRPVTAAEIDALPRGDALNPEHGARLFAAVTALEDRDGLEQPPAAGELALKLTGPGIRDVRRLGVRGLPVAVAEALVAANSGFPLGVDTFLVTAGGAVAGLPRTTRIVIEAVGE